VVILREFPPTKNAGHDSGSWTIAICPAKMKKSWWKNALVMEDMGE